MLIKILQIFCCCSILLFFSSERLAAASFEDAFISADFIEYNSNEGFIYAEGNIKAKVEQYIITADRLFYDIEKDTLWAEKNVIVTDQEHREVTGEVVIFKDKLKRALIANFILKFNDNTILASRLAERINEDQAELYKTSFTPCQITGNCPPIWQISASHTFVDLDKQRIIYKNLFFEVYGKPIFYLPYLSHPTPGAKAQSGLLVPGIDKNSLRIPIYFRAQPNLDFTFTPRIAYKYNIYEIEARHLVPNGNYNVYGSYGKVPYRIQSDGKEIKNTKVNSYHIFSAGNFYQQEYDYGFSLNRSSDKAYLKNYYGQHHSYLQSNLYLNRIIDYDYFSLEGLYFQDMKGQTTQNNDSLVLPQFKSKNIINLSEDENTYAIIQTNGSAFREIAGKRVNRATAQLEVTNDHIIPNGSVISLTAYSRAYAYIVDDSQHNQNSQLLTRSISELQTTWRHPLVSKINSFSSASIEPKVMVAVGRKYKESDAQFNLIDASKYELAEENLFLSNRYSGIDYHEFGNRISYGFDSGLLSNRNYFSLFLGQLIAERNSKNSYLKENVGKFQLSFLEGVELFYRFRKNRHFSSIREEVGANFVGNEVSLSTSFIMLENVSNYYASDNLVFSKNRVKQFHYDIAYHLNSNWLIGNEMHLDLANKKSRILYRNVKVTYAVDCVSITGKIAHDYMGDSSRGIKKIRSTTISLGLKVINM